MDLKGYIIVNNNKIDVISIYSCSKIKSKIKTLIINQNIYLSKRDIIGFQCSHCSKIEEHQFRFKEKFFTDNILCDSCNKSLNNPYKRDDVKKKIKEIKLNKYGDENFTNKEKAILTNLKKHGKEYYNNKEKAILTNLEKYGKEYPLQNIEIYNKMLFTKKNKYGNENYNNREKYIKSMFLIKHKVAKKIKLSKLENMYNHFSLYNIIPLFTLKKYLEKENKYDKFQWKCTVCNTEFEDYYANGRTPRCPICYPKIFLKEKEVGDYCKSLGLEVRENDRSIISPYEVDIYLPDYKLAIEYNGLFWHSTKFIKDKYYHQNKVKLAKEKGIRLLHIWEHEWLEEQEQTKEKIQYYINNQSIFIETKEPELCNIHDNLIWI